MKSVIELAKENCPYHSEEMRGAYYDGFVRAAALVRAEELEAVYEEFYLRVTSDLEHGVKSSNERAADKFKKEYPQLYKFWEWLNIRIGDYEGDEE